MNWACAIEKNRAALAAVLTGLAAIAAAGILPRCTHGWLARLVLRAESTARRLIFLFLREIGVEIPAARSGAAPDFSALSAGRSDAARPLALIDPRKNFETAPFPAGSFSSVSNRSRATHPIMDLTGHLAVLQMSARLLAEGPRSRDRAMAASGGDQLVRKRRAGVPRISFGGDGHARRNAPLADDLLDASPLGLRLEALGDALADLPRAARRLARLMARRKDAPPGPRRVGPVRPGYPPGWRRRPAHPVDLLLDECQRLVGFSQARPP
jgi:hypothetical protein